MEERRLKNILCHLSAYSSSQLGNSSALKSTSKAEEHPVYLPGNAHWQPEAHIIISRSRSSSDMMESRRLGFVEEAHMRGDPSFANSSKQVPRHGYNSASAAEAKGGGSLQLKNHSFEEVGDYHVLKTHTRGYSFDTDLTCFGHNCTPSGIAKFERSRLCKPLHSKDETAIGLQEEWNDCRHNHAPVLSPEGNHHQQIIRWPQLRIRSSDVMQNTEEGDIQTCRDPLIFESETAEVANDTVVGSISRNNVMTGQRMRLMEDCIFCLIIQGQSPSFKLYEDEMCICILDVHPLSHGHALLIPKAHFTSLEFTPPEVAAAMCATVPLISMAIMQATNCDSFNLLVNSGKAAGQVVFHTHFHIIPRRSGDNLWRSEDGNRRALPMGHETALLVQQIRHNLSNKCL